MAIYIYSKQCREDIEKVDHIVPPEFGLYLPPKTEGSWFLRFAIRAQYIVIFTQYLFINHFSMLFGQISQGLCHIG